MRGSLFRYRVCTRHCRGYATPVSKSTNADLVKQWAVPLQWFWKSSQHRAPSKDTNILALNFGVPDGQSFPSTIPSREAGLTEEWANAHHQNSTSASVALSEIVENGLSPRLLTIPHEAEDQVNGMGKTESDFQPLNGHPRQYHENTEIFQTFRAIRDSMSTRDVSQVDVAVLFDAYLRLPRPRVCYMSRKDLRVMLIIIMRQPRSDEATHQYLTLLNDMKENGTFIRKSEWTTALHRVSHVNHRHDLADTVQRTFEVYDAMQSVGVPPDNVTLNVLLHIAILARRWYLVDILRLEMKRRNILLDTVSWTEILRMHGEMHNINALQIDYARYIQNGGTVDIVLVKNVITALLKAGNPRKAEEMYLRLRNYVIRQPGHDNSNSELSALSLSQSVPKIGLSTGDLRRQHRMLLNIHSVLQNARQPLTRPVDLRPDTAILNYFVAYHCQSTGYFADAVWYVREMERFNNRPDAITFMYLFEGFYKHGNSLQENATDESGNEWNGERLDTLYTVLYRSLSTSERIDLKAITVLWAVRAFGKLSGPERAREVWESLRGYVDVAHTNIQRMLSQARDEIRDFGTEKKIALMSQLRQNFKENISVSKLERHNATLKLDDNLVALQQLIIHDRTRKRSSTGKEAGHAMSNDQINTDRIPETSREIDPASFHQDGEVTNTFRQLKKPRVPEFKSKVRKLVLKHENQRGSRYILRPSQTAFSTPVKLPLGASVGEIRLRNKDREISNSMVTERLTQTQERITNERLQPEGPNADTILLESEASSIEDPRLNLVKSPGPDRAADSMSQESYTSARYATEQSTSLHTMETSVSMSLLPNQFDNQVRKESSTTRPSDLETRGYGK